VEEEYESYAPKKNIEENVMQELEESYRKSKSAPVVPPDMKNELNNLSSGDDEEDDTLSYFQKLANQ
jgi:hypothetical protein